MPKLTCNTMVRYTYIVKVLVLQYKDGKFSREWTRYGVGVGYRSEASAWNAITENWQYVVDANCCHSIGENAREIIAFDVVRSIAFDWS